MHILLRCIKCDADASYVYDGDSFCKDCMKEINDDIPVSPPASEKECNHIKSVEPDEWGDTILFTLQDGNIDTTTTTEDFEYCPKCGRRNPECGKKLL